MIKKLYADLHIHTSSSDGTTSSEDIVDIAKKEDVSIIAITDHNTTRGITKELYSKAENENILIIPGVELSVSFDKNIKLHLIGLGIDYQNEALVRFLPLSSYPYIIPGCTQKPLKLLVFVLSIFVVIINSSLWF